MTTNIRVDFNSIGRDGALLSHLSRADGPVSPGDEVEAWEDDLRFRVRVHSVGESGVVRMTRPGQTT